MRQEFVDRQEIYELVRLERFWRDQREWQKLADMYVPESQVCTTWFLGAGREFAAASRELYEKRGSRAKHMIWPAHCRVNGDRALCESPGTIYSRNLFGGYTVSQELPGDARQDITDAYYAKADRWLETGENFF